MLGQLTLDLFGRKRPGCNDLGNGAASMLSVGKCWRGRCFWLLTAQERCGINCGILGDGKCIETHYLWLDEVDGVCADCRHLEGWKCSEWPGVYAMRDNPERQTCGMFERLRGREPSETNEDATTAGNEGKRPSQGI